MKKQSITQAQQIKSIFVSLDRGKHKSCMICHAKFGITTSEHQCKRCLRAICEKCGPHKAFVQDGTKASKKPHRQCIICKDEYDSMKKFIEKYKVQYNQDSFSVEWLGVYQTTVQDCKQNYESVKEQASQKNSQNELDIFKSRFVGLYNEIDKLLNYSMNDFAVLAYANLSGVQIKSLIEKVVGTFLLMYPEVGYSADLVVIAHFLLCFASEASAYFLLTIIYGFIIPPYIYQKNLTQDGYNYSNEIEMVMGLCKDVLKLSQIDLQYGRTFLEVRMSRYILCLGINFFMFETSFFMINSLFQSQKNYQDYLRCMASVISLNSAEIKRNTVNFDESELFILRNSRANEISISFQQTKKIQLEKYMIEAVPNNTPINMKGLKVEFETQEDPSSNQLEYFKLLEKSKQLELALEQKEQIVQDLIQQNKAQDIGRIQNQLLQKQIELDELTNQNTNLTEQLAQLNDNHANKLQYLGQELTSIQNSNAKQTEIIGQLEQQLLGKNEEYEMIIQQLRSQLDEQNSKVVINPDSTVEQNNEQINDLNKLNGELNQRVKELEIEVTMLNQKQTEQQAVILQYSQEIQSCKLISEEQQSRENVLESKLLEQSQQLENVNNALEVSISVQKDLQFKNEEQLEQIKQLQIQLSSIVENCNDQVKAKEELKLLLEQETSKLINLQQEAQQAQASVVRYESETQELQTKIQELEETIKGYTEELEKLQALVSSQEQITDMLKDSVIEANQLRINELEEETKAQHLMIKKLKSLDLEQDNELQEQIKVLTEQQVESGVIIKEQDEIIKQLNEEKEQTSKLITSLQHQCEEQNNNLTEISSKLEQQRIEAQEIQSQRDLEFELILKEEISKQQAIQQQLQNKIDEVSVVLQNEKQLNIDMQTSHRDQISGIQLQLRTIQVEQESELKLIQDTLESKCQDFESQIQELQTTLSTKEQIIIDLKSQAIEQDIILEYEAQLNQHMSKHKAIQAEVESLKLENTTLKSELEVQLNQSQLDKKHYDQQLEIVQIQHDQKLQEVDESKVELQQQIDVLKYQLEYIRQEIVKYQQIAPKFDKFTMILEFLQNKGYQIETGLNKLLECIDQQPEEQKSISPAEFENIEKMAQLQLENEYLSEKVRNYKLKLKDKSSLSEQIEQLEQLQQQSVKLMEEIYNIAIQFQGGSKQQTLNFADPKTSTSRTKVDQEDAQNIIILRDCQIQLLKQYIVEKQNQVEAMSRGMIQCVDLLNKYKRQIVD